MKLKYTLALALIASAAALASCSTTEQSSKPIDVADLDPSVVPGDDFYQFSNGGWLKTATIPDDKVRYGAFDLLQETTEEKVKDIMHRAQMRQFDSTDANWTKIGDFYASGMDTAAIEAAGITPILPDIEQIASVQNANDIVREIARQRAIGGAVPFYVSVSQDSKQVTQQLLAFYQSGLGMPDRDYYFDETERGKQIQAGYIKMITQIFQLLGKTEDIALSVANDIFAVEKRLANASLTRLEYRNPHLRYNKLSKEALTKLTPQFDWNLYFQNLGINAPDSVLVDNPKFLQEVNAMLAEVPVNIWADYMTLHFVTSYASSLNRQLEDIVFDFEGRLLSGQQAQTPRWRRVMRRTQAALGEAVGQVYVSENFPPEAKEKMKELVEDLRAAYSERINKLTWMSDATKARAQEKLKAIRVKIGYPDKWKDYSELSVSRESYAMNVRNMYTFRFNETMAKLGKPVDRSEWFMTPQTVNAYYSPTMNEIVFPAAILQPPFFDLKADDAVNYGGIGVVIGHEITHGFDDQGRLYNQEGNLENWWTPEDADRFNENAKLLVEQFNDFEPLKGHNVNGSLTLGENLADYGGLMIAFDALHRLQERTGASNEEKIDGFTPPQRFFISYSKIWRNLIRDEELIRRLKNDVHSPGKYRVNGGVYNIEAFYQAFDVKETSPYYRKPEQRPTIW